MTAMQVAPEAVLSDVCSMLDQIHQLQSCSVDDGAQKVSLIDSVNTALEKLPADSLLHTQWQKTKSQNEEVVTLINVRRSDLLEARTQLDPDARNSHRKIETPSCRSSGDISSLLSTQQQSNAGNNSPPVCHVKPTQVLSETTTNSSPTAPFDVRNYLIDKNAPITEPVFKPPHLTPLVQDNAVKSAEVVQRQSSDTAAPVRLNCSLSSTVPVKSAVKPAATSLYPVRSPWKMLKKKAVSLFTDGLGRSTSQSEHGSPHRINAGPTSTDSLHRLEYSCLLLLYS